MKKLLSGMTLCCICTSVYAQEVNVGIHANPLLGTPVMSKGRSVLQESLKTTWRAGYNVGANINVKFNKLGLELGANYLGKPLSVTQRQQQLGFDTYYRVVIPSKAVELPVTLNLLMHRHDKNSIYDAYFVIGAGYETGKIDSSLSSAVYSGSGGGGSGFSVDGRYEGNKRYSTADVIVGFKINAVLRNVGLIDYGLSFHFPITANGPYVYESNYSIAGTSAYKNTVYAHTAYVDVKLAYYFLNIGKDMKRMRYGRRD